MRINYRRKFLKQFNRLQRSQQLAVNDVIERFRQNPLDRSLRNHPLRGDMKGQRSISAGFDLRIIFEEREGYTVVIMIAVGSHEEVY